MDASANSIWRRVDTLHFTTRIRSVATTFTGTIHSPNSAATKLPLPHSDCRKSQKRLFPRGLEVRQNYVRGA